MSIDLYRTFQRKPGAILVTVRLIWKMENDLILNPHGCPNGLETMSENLMLKAGFRNQVAPPLKEKYDRPKIGASFG
jgi:hypothetical protein